MTPTTIHPTAKPASLLRALLCRIGLHWSEEISNRPGAQLDETITELRCTGCGRKKFEVSSEWDQMSGI